MYVYRFTNLLSTAPLHCLAALLLLPFLLGCCPGGERDRCTSVESWTASHSGDADFIPKARMLIDSTANRSPAELEGFVRRMADALCKQGKEQLAASIAAYPHGIDLPGDEYSRIGQRLLTQLRLPGNLAPQLPIPDMDRLEAKGLVVLFFESDCHSCQAVIDELTAAYDSLATAGVRIVSIASDSNPNRYSGYVEKLPWKDKYCDYESFSGIYFTCWGVAYTPAMYYVDGAGIVRGQYRALQEIKDEIPPKEIPGGLPGV